MLPREPRRVAYVLKMYPRLAETFILNEILAHEAAGLELDIFSLRAPVDGRFHGDLGRVQALVTYLPPSVKSDELWSLLCAARGDLEGVEKLLDLASGETSGNVHQAILLARAVRERGIDHLHAHFATDATAVARLAARLAGVPYTFTAHAKDIYHEEVRDQDLRRKLRDAAAVVTVSDYNVRHLRERFGPEAAVVRRVYNGLDLSEFPYRAPAARPPVIVGVGRLVDKKGFHVLIDACAELDRRGRSYRCDIVGDGVLRPDLEAQIADRGVGNRVRLLGAQARDAVREHIHGAAVMAAPCVISPTGNRDGMPTVLLEAMALGTPCVSTDVTGIPELVRHGETGLLAKQGDPGSLAASLERLLDDGPLRVALAERARRLVEAEYDIRTSTQRLREIFRAAASSRPAARPAALEVR
jgi:glycosyltransferase involved in cell wall biosynthesis